MQRLSNPPGVVDSASNPSILLRWVHLDRAPKDTHKHTLSLSFCGTQTLLLPVKIPFFAAAFQHQLFFSDILVLCATEQFHRNIRPADCRLLSAGHLTQTHAQCQTGPTDFTRITDKIRGPRSRFLSPSSFVQYGVPFFRHFGQLWQQQQQQSGWRNNTRTHAIWLPKRTCQTKL